MIKYILLFGLLLICLNLEAQFYGYTLLDIEKDGGNFPYNIEYINEEFLFILSGDIFENKLGSQISLLNENLEIIEHVYDTIDHGNHNPIFIDSEGNYILSGHRFGSMIDPIFIKRGNFFTKESELTYVLNDGNSKSNEGLLLNSNKLFVYGDSKINTTGFVKGYIGIFDTASYALDTLIYYNQNANENHIRNLQVLSDSTMVFMNDAETGSDKFYYLTKIDFNGNVIDSFQYISSFSFIPRSCVTNSGDIIFNSTNFLVEDANSLGKIHKLDKDFKTVVWSYILKQTPQVVDRYWVHDIIELQNEDLLVAGQYFEGISGDTAQYYGFLQRLSKDGEPIWFKRYHIPFTEPHPTAEWINFAYFARVKEREDGSFIVLGRTRSLEPDINFYLWMLSLTSEGCLSIEEDVCDPTGIIVHTDDITTPSFSQQSLVTYPNPTSGICNVRLPESMSGTYSVFDIFGATILKGSFLLQSEIELRLNNVGMYSIRVFDSKGNEFISKVQVIQ